MKRATPFGSSDLNYPSERSFSFIRPALPNRI
jgi:hypothetical protein